MGASASAQSKAVSAILEADGMDFDDLAAAIGANAEASRIVGDVFVRMPPNVVTEVNARLGYVKEDQQAHHAALPPELQNFKVLAKYESVQVIFNHEDFASAVADVRILEFRRVELDKEEATPLWKLVLQQFDDLVRDAHARPHSRSRTRAQHTHTHHPLVHHAHRLCAPLHLL